MFDDFSCLKFSRGYTPEDIPENDLYWLAGILEGEGCFKSSCGYGNSIVFGMTDIDIVQRVSDIFETTIQNPIKRPPLKDMHYLQISGDKAARWMVVLRPLMSTRRQAAIDKAMVNWRAAPGKTHNKGKGRIPTCHPKRRHHSRGLCNLCYQQARRNGEF